MPIIIAIVALFAIASGAFFFFSNSSATPAVQVSPVTEVISTTTPPSVVSTNPPVAATGTVATGSTSTQPTPTTATPPGATTPTPTTPAAPVTKTLTAKADYKTPSSDPTSIAVTMVIDNDIVTSVNTTYTGDGTSKGYQSRFDGAYKTQVVGKKLGDISLSRVGGASLTSKAFNEVVKQMIAQS